MILIKGGSNDCCSNANCKDRSRSPTIETRILVFLEWQIHDNILDHVSLHGFNVSRASFFTIERDQNGSACHGGGLPFEPLEIADQVADLTRIQPEFWHIWMAGDDAFTECFFECFDRITVVRGAALSGLAVTLSIEWHLAQFVLAKVKPRCC
jgi:hypothetical protein